MALTTNKGRLERTGRELAVPVAAGEEIFAGSAVVKNATGYAEVATTATGKVSLGRSEQHIDNTAGADGDATVRVRKGVFPFTNSGTDPVTIADVGNDVYWVDDDTIARTDGTGSRSLAGKLFALDSDGAWVDLR